MPSAPKRLTQIDELLLDEHARLTREDECFALREYTASVGYSHSETNSLILNLKKEMNRKGLPDWGYKSLAIRRIAGELKEAAAEFLKGATIVPMPPSKAKTDAMYDDRMVQIAELMAKGSDADVRELLAMRASAAAFHKTTGRRDFETLQSTMCIDEAVAAGAAPAHIIVLDDLLTSGGHFRVAKDLLTARFPGVPVMGLFVARRIPLPAAPDDADDA